MNQGKTILSQIMSFVSKYEFNKCVEKLSGNYKVRSFTCWEQFIVMSFAQLTYRSSLRDIETCLRAMKKKLYHSGVKSSVSKSTLSDANESRDWRIYSDFSHILIKQARELYKIEHDFTLELDNMVYALDSTTIDLCLSLFPWAKFRKTKSAVKVHTLLDIRGSIPTFVSITNGKIHDVNIVDSLHLEPGSFYLLDRGYINYKRLDTINDASAFFVTRAKGNIGCRRLYSRPVDKSSGLRYDQTITLTSYYIKKRLPQQIETSKIL